MSKTLRDQDYLSHIQEAINKIHRFIAGKSEMDFIADDLIQDAVIRNLEIIGEAVTKLSAELKAEYKDVPWGEISGMRNRLIHGYISVNLQIVWDTVERLLPALLEQIKNIEKIRSRKATFDDGSLVEQDIVNHTRSRACGCLPECPGAPR